MIAACVASQRACRSSSVKASTRSTAGGSLFSGGGGAGAWGGRVGGSAIGSGGPAQEVDQNAQTDLLALFDVELGAGAVAGGHHRHDGAAVVGGGDHLVRHPTGERVAVHEVGM